MPEILSHLPTVGVIAHELGVPLHRVEYIIRARGIAPVGRAGNARVFSDADVQRIAAELRGESSVALSSANGNGGEV